MKYVSLDDVEKISNSRRKIFPEPVYLFSIETLKELKERLLSNK